MSEEAKEVKIPNLSNVQGTSVVLEVLLPNNEDPQFVIRTVQGQPIRLCKSVDEVVTFLNEFISLGRNGN